MTFEKYAFFSINARNCSFLSIRGVILLLLKIFPLLRTRITMAIYRLIVVIIHWKLNIDGRRVRLRYRDMLTLKIFFQTLYMEFVPPRIFKSHNNIFSGRFLIKGSGYLDSIDWSILTACLVRRSFNLVILSLKSDSFR